MKRLSNYLKSGSVTDLRAALDALGDALQDAGGKLLPRFD
jgi:hypothetical protein